VIPVHAVPVLRICDHKHMLLHKRGFSKWRVRARRWHRDRPQHAVQAREVAEPEAQE